MGQGPVHGNHTAAMSTGEDRIDTFGHEAGDSVLLEVGTLLSRSARAEDIASRFGGEEFVLILPGATLDGAQSRAERLRSKARELTVLHHGKSVGMITISVGVSAFPLHGLSVKDVIEAADAALYRAKKNGRDRVVVAESTTPTDTAAPAALIADGQIRAGDQAPLQLPSA
jgi:diguanylate cyclase (GGDEF)-like protein